jgi:manganese efflux pump family protein
MELSWLALLALSVGLAMDALAVAVAAGLTIGTVTPRHVFRLGFHFGLFQFMMPIIGWLAGESLTAYIDGYDCWLAFALLGYVGGKMLWEARGPRDPENSNDPTRGLRLVTLSVATSIDALAVGMSMALLGVSVWFPSVVIGAVTAALTAVGISFGAQIGSRWGRWAEVTGGLVLILLGLKFLIGHLAGT